MTNKIIYVWSAPQTIKVCQKSENVWAAKADYGYTPIRCEATSEIDAIKRWVKAARTVDDPNFDGGPDLAGLDDRINGRDA